MSTKVDPFKTKLRAELVRDTSSDGRGTWQLLAPLVYESKVAAQTFVVPADFVTDLASVPRLPFAYLLTGGLAHGAAVVHDWLYTTHLIDREKADAVFHEAAIACGVSAWQAWLMWAGVRVGGGGSWDAPGAQQPVLVQQQISAADLVAP